MTVRASRSLPPLRDVIQRHGLRARRSLGQNFLLDLNLTEKIARTACDLPGSDVVEIGPGPGGLTRALLAAGARHVHAIERDERCLDALREIAATCPGRLTIIPGDALDIDPVLLGRPPRRIVANLPYNIATSLLLKWLRQTSGLDEMVLMFQKEVADRLTARPGTKAYGRLSVVAQWLFHVRHAFDVPARAFTPSPKVESALVVLTPRPRPLAPARFEALEAVARAAFGQRRKMLRSSLKPLGIGPNDTGLDLSRRAETLDIEEFCMLARVIEGTILPVLLTNAHLADKVR